MPLRRGHVDHVDRDDDRHAQIEHLAGQVEVAVEVGRIDDGDDDVRPRFLRSPAEQQIDRDHLVRAARGEAVGAGQVDEVATVTPSATNCPFFISTVTPG